VPEMIAPEPVSKGLAARAVGVIVSPRSTYADVARWPRWFGVLLLAVLIGGTAATMLAASEVGQQAVLDQQLTQAEASGRHLTDAQVQRLEQMAPYYKYFALPFQAVTLIVLALVVAGLALTVFTVLLGGDARFKQVFAIVAHSAMVTTLGALFIFPLDYVRKTMTSPTNLMVFLPFVDENTFLGRLFSAIDLIYVWWAVSLAIGLGVLYKRKTGPIASTILGIYAVLALVIAGVRTALAGA